MNPRCDIHLIPLERFLDKPPVSQQHVDNHFLKSEEFFLDRLRHYRHYPKWDDGALPIGDTGYSMLFAQPSGTGGCIILTHMETREVVGGCDSLDFYIAPAHRGKGLGGVILLAAFDESVRRNPEIGHRLSPDGKRAYMSAHRLAVARALEDGLEVPDEVLKDYPALVTPAAQPPAPQDQMDEPSF